MPMCARTRPHVRQIRSVKMSDGKDMKKIDINSDAWNQLHNLRKKLKYKKWSAVILWLLKYHSLHQEKTYKINDLVSVEKNTDVLKPAKKLEETVTKNKDIRPHIDLLIKAKNLEETVAKKESPVLEMKCLQCNGIPFIFDASGYDDELGLVCPTCGFQYGVAIFLEEKGGKMKC